MNTPKLMWGGRRARPLIRVVIGKVKRVSLSQMVKAQVSRRRGRVTAKKVSAINFSRICMQGD